MAVVIPATLQQRIFTHLQSTYPNEGGGFLLGQVTENTKHIVDTIQINNVFAEEEQYHRYAMTPQDWVRLEDEADERNLTLIGYYHSHPDAPAIPSVYDRDHAWPNFIYLITSIEQGRAVDMRAWHLQADRTAFDADNLVVE